MLPNNYWSCFAIYAYLCPSAYIYVYLRQTTLDPAYLHMIEKTWHPKTVVGCRGGSRYVEGVGDFEFSDFQFSKLQNSNCQILKSPIFKFKNVHFHISTVPISQISGVDISNFQIFEFSNLNISKVSYVDLSTFS